MPRESAPLVCFLLDVFTKTLPRPPFEKHALKYAGVDEYMSPNQGRVSQGDWSSDSNESTDD
jgi:hypothetical protein